MFEMVAYLQNSPLILGGIGVARRIRHRVVSSAHHLGRCIGMAVGQYAAFALLVPAI